MKYYAFSLIAFIGLLSFVCGCTADYEVSETSHLVVEGWIDAEGYPMVIVTQSVPVSEQSQPLSGLESYLVRWAKVTVSDGDNEVILTGKVDKHYFPPYIYTSSHIKGEVGKTYHLTVEYDGQRAEATTTIPQPIDLDSLRVLPIQGNDTLYQIMAYFHDDPTQRNFYKFFSLDGRYSNMFLSSYMQTVNDDVLNPGEEVSVSIYKGRMMKLEGGKNYTPYYTIDDTVRIKFAHIDSLSYEFWNLMENSSTLSVLPGASVGNPRFNVHGDATGYWCGYGARFYSVVIRDSVLSVER